MKDLQYYMNLNYPVTITPIPEDEGGGYAVSIPMLGKYAYIGDGETIEEALENLDKVKRYLFQEALERGIRIPEPEEKEEEIRACSGRVLVRLPRELHYALKCQADNNNTSLNSWISYLLARGELAQTVVESVLHVSSQVTHMSRNVGMLSYHLSRTVYDVRAGIISPEFEPGKPRSGRGAIPKGAYPGKLAAA